MIGNVNQPSTAQIIDVDGTLKAGAVDVAAVIGDTIITDAKLVTDAKIGSLAMLTTTAKNNAVAAINEINALIGATAPNNVNLAPDPYSEYFDPPLGAPNARTYWINGANLTMVSPDANNPFGRRTLRIKTEATQAGRRFYLDDCGLVVGQTISVGLYAKGADGVTFTLYCSFKSAADATISIDGIEFTADGTSDIYAVENITIPDETVALNLFVGAKATSGAIDIYAFLIVAGSAMQLASGNSLHSGVLALNSTSSVNLAFDPFTEYYAPDESPDARLRWFSGSSFSIVSPDADNPFGRRTLRMGTSAVNGGRKFWLDEAGIKIGDTISVGMYIKAPVGLTFSVGVLYRTSSNATISQVYGDAFTGDGTAKLYTYTNTTIPATCVALDIWIASKATSGSLDIYAFYLVRGHMLAPTMLVPIGIVNGSYAMAAVEAARGSAASLDARLNVALNEDGTLRSDAISASGPTFNRHYLRSWLGQLAKIRTGATESASLVMFGDSWVHGVSLFQRPLQGILQTEYGNAGIGWVSASTDHTVPDNVTRTPAGTWTYPTLTGPNLGSAASSDTDASMAFVATFTDAIIHYAAQSGGGYFRYSVDGGGWTSVNTDGAAAYATVSITGLSNASHTLTIQVETSGTAGILLHGVDLRLAVSGVRIHKIGRMGAIASLLADLDATEFAESLTALDPDCVMILYGTNEHSTGVTPAAYTAALTTIIDRVRAALPLCDVLLVAPADNGLAPGTYTLSDYADAARALAIAKICAMCDGYMLLGPYADSDDRGLYSDYLHINAYGGRVICGTLANDLLWLA